MKVGGINFQMVKDLRKEYLPLLSLHSGKSAIPPRVFSGVGRDVKSGWRKFHHEKIIEADSTPIIAIGSPCLQPRL